LSTPTITAPAGLTCTFNTVIEVTVTVENGAVTLGPAQNYEVVQQKLGSGQVVNGITFAPAPPAVEAAPAAASLKNVGGPRVTAEPHPAPPPPAETFPARELPKTIPVPKLPPVPTGQ
jgi:uncharacterized membrane protein